MSFRSGWPAGCFFAVYIFVLSFIVRFIFGAHTLEQAGIECLTLGLYGGFAYALGYYLSDMVGHFCYVFWHDIWHLIYTIGGAVIMWNLGEHMHATYAASFTSTFFLIVFSGVGALMAYLGFDDERSEAYMQYLQAHNML